MKVFILHCSPSRPTDELSGAQGKLMRLVELQLSQGDGPVDLVHLSNQFSLADRLHRNTLSHGEVRCFHIQCHVTHVYSTLLFSIIHVICETNNIHVCTIIIALLVVSL